MEDRKNDMSELQQTLVDGFQRMANVSMSSVKPLMDRMLENVSAANKTMLDGGIPSFNLVSQNKKTNHCSPPDQTCPPHCIAMITRRAMRGERIVVPFLVKNDCSSTRTYRVGIRDLESQDGRPAAEQPKLNKATITLEPARSVRVILVLDLLKFDNGVYTAEIVLREKDINQNICFKLYVEDHATITAVPRDEKKYKLKWQNWQSHFYCEPPLKKVVKDDGAVVDGGLDIRT